MDEEGLYRNGQTLKYRNFFAGNGIIDTLLSHMDKVASSDILDRLELSKHGYAVLTLRENTERPVTVTQWTNVIVGTDPAKIVNEGQVILNGGGKKGSIPGLWAGRSVEEIMAILAQAFGGGSEQERVI